LRLPCLRKYHGLGRASRDALRAWSAGLGFYRDTWAALRAGLRAALRVGPPGRATHRAAGLRYASGRGPRCTPDQLQRAALRVRLADELRGELRAGLWAGPGRALGRAGPGRTACLTNHCWTFRPAD
jgi:hypothetical protein